MTSIASIADFQARFAHALMYPDVAPEDSTIRRLAMQPGFAVYRNTVMKGCIDALQANYPAVARLVGDEWFRAAAAVFVRERPPRTPVLLDYGEAFAAFLVAFEPARELPYLADVARIDRFWTEAHVAIDEAPVPAADIARLDPPALGRVVLRPHGSARWAWFDASPAVTIWRRSRAPDLQTVDALDWCGEGVLVVRPHDEVEHHALDRAGCAFLGRCAQGATVLEAALAALTAAPDTDLARLMAGLLAAGAFGRMTFVDVTCEGALA